MKEIIVDFGNIVEEMENKHIKLCLINGIIGWFAIDSKNHFCKIEDYYCGGYLDKYIIEKNKIKFRLIPESASNSTKDWKKEIWGIEDVKGFIDRQSKYWI